MRIMVFSAFLLSSAALGGCADDPAEREWRRQQAAQRREQMAAIDRCAATLPAYRPGERPPQPYTVIAPMDGRWGWTSTSRFMSMKRKACELGADAIIDASETYADVGPTREVWGRDRFGRPVRVVEHEPQRVRETSAVAIRFVR